MKKISLLITAILVLVGCSKLEIYEANLPGTWSESYDASKFAFDGILRYTFDGGDTYMLYTSNPDGSSQNTTTGKYTLESEGKYIQKMTGDDSIIITLNPDDSDDSNVSYVIVKLTSSEKAWQKVGTTYSEGTWGSDYRHFVRK